MENSIYSILEISKNIGLAFGGTIIGIVGVLSSVKIYRNNKKIQRKNKEIEKANDVLDKVEIENKTNDGSINLNLEQGNFDQMKVLKQRKKINKLKREKQYFFDEISVYKIFKK